MYRFVFESNFNPETDDFNFDLYHKNFEKKEEALAQFKEVLDLSKTLIYSFLEGIYKNIPETDEIKNVFFQIMKTVKSLKVDEPIELAANDGTFLILEENYFNFDFLDKKITIIIKEEF